MAQHAIPTRQCEVGHLRLEAALAAATPHYLHLFSDGQLTGALYVCSLSAAQTSGNPQDVASAVLKSVQRTLEGAGTVSELEVKGREET